MQSEKRGVKIDPPWGFKVVYRRGRRPPPRFSNSILKSLYLTIVPPRCFRNLHLGPLQLTYSPAADV